MGRYISEVRSGPPKLLKRHWRYFPESWHILDQIGVQHPVAAAKAEAKG